MTKAIVEVQMTGSIHDKLKLASYTTIINRDSLYRSMSQSNMIAVEFFVQMLIGGIYSSLDRAINKDKKGMHQSSDTVNEVLNDLWGIRNKLFEEEKND